MILLLQAQAAKIPQNAPELWHSPNKLFPIFIAAIVGTLIGLLINRFMLSYDNRVKYRNIRKLFASDLKKQFEEMNTMLSDIDKCLPACDIYQKDYIHIPIRGLRLNHGINIDTFKSQTRIDIFKSFKEEDFFLLIAAYDGLKYFENINIHQITERFINDFNKKLSETLTTDIESGVEELASYCEIHKEKLTTYRNNIAAIICNIGILEINIKLNYKLFSLTNVLNITKLLIALAIINLIIGISLLFLLESIPTK